MVTASAVDPAGTHDPRFDVREALYHATGMDRTAIEGNDPMLDIRKRYAGVPYVFIAQNDCWAITAYKEQNDRKKKRLGPRRNYGRFLGLSRRETPRTSGTLPCRRFLLLPGAIASRRPTRPILPTPLGTNLRRQHGHRLLKRRAENYNSRLSLCRRHPSIPVRRSSYRTANAGAIALSGVTIRLIPVPRFRRLAVGLNLGSARTVVLLIALLELRDRPRPRKRPLCESNRR
jgi:hypothetical protein